MLTQLPAELAAEIIENIPDVRATDIIADMDAVQAAAIVNEMHSDEQADLLLELDDEEAEAILSLMDLEEAEDARKLITYESDTAGGLMITEFISVPETYTVSEAIEYLREHVEEFMDYQIKYLYVSGQDHAFKGVLQMQDLLLAKGASRLSELLVPAKTVSYDTDLDALIYFFDKYPFFGVPVMDEAGKIIGVVMRKSVLEADSEKISKEHLETQGIIGGDELRSMPVWLRSRRRLSWLSVNVLLNIVAASVIAYHQDTLSSVIALAVFLPIISDMSGCSGNQAVAVSMRELSLGTVKPKEVMRVWGQELSVGLINGLALGALIGLAAWLWKGNVYLGLVAGGALAINTLVAVSIGGTVPLILKGLDVDPALASGPILTTITDMFGFFLALTFATMMLSNISGL